MEHRPSTYTVGAVALLAALAYVAGFFGPALTQSGWLGWLDPPALLSTALWLVSIAVLFAASRVLLSGEPASWVTVALAFMATSALLELDTLGFLVSILVPGAAGLSGWTIVGIGTSVVLTIAGVLAVVVLRRAPAATTRLRPVAPVARVARVATAAFAVAVIALPQWYDETGRSFGSVLGSLDQPGGLPAGLWVQIVTSAIEPLLVTVAVALIARRDLWLGVVGALATQWWGYATGVLLSPTFPFPQAPAIGSWVILAAFATVVALLVSELRRGGPGAEAEDPASRSGAPDTPDPEAVPAETR